MAAMAASGVSRSLGPNRSTGCQVGAAGRHRMARGDPNQEQGVPVLLSPGESHLVPAMRGSQPAPVCVPELAGADLVLPVPMHHGQREFTGRQRRYLRAGLVACSMVALCCCAVAIVGRGDRVQRSELLWDRYALEDASAEDHDLWGGRQMVADILRERSAHIATRVGRRFQDDERIGEVLGHAANVAFDTIVEVKRAMRGLQYEAEDSVFNSKIEVAETMLAHLMSKLGISEVPPPPHTTRLATVKTAMRMARDLRMILSKIPTGTDARDFREARYNLAVYDLDQVSRQISDIMLKLSEDDAYQELQEPAFSRFDAVMADAQAGLADANEAFGGGEDHNKAWERATWESKMNLLPKWKRNQKEYQDMAQGETIRLSQRLSGPNEQAQEPSKQGEQELPIDKIIGDPNPAMDVGMIEPHIVHPSPPPPPPHQIDEEEAPIEVPVVCVDAEDHHPHHDEGVLCSHTAPEEDQQPLPQMPPVEDSGEALIREAVAAAMKQDARAESSHPALVDRLAERRIEAMAVRSVMNQLQRTESNRHFLVAQDGTPDGPGPREWGTELAQVPNGGRMEQLAMIPLSMSSPLIKKQKARERLAAKQAKQSEVLKGGEGRSKSAGLKESKARLQSLAQDPRDDVIVADEKGFSEGQINHPEGQEGSSQASSQETREEGRERGRGAVADLSREERRGVSGGEHLRDGEGAGAYRTVSGEGGDVTTGAEWLTSPENNLQPRLPYDLQLEKDAVYQASKTGMIMELNHPGWQDSVENAASVAVDAAIRAETYNGGDALTMVERAAVEGATKAAKEMEIKAEEDGSKGPAEQAVAQRVENSAVRAAIMAANEVQAEHERKVVYLPPRPLPSSITISSPNPAAAQPLAAGLVSPYGYPPAAAAPAPVEEALPGGGNAGIAAAAASAMGVGAMPMLAAAGAPQGLAMGAGTSFVPDPPSGQTLAGYVEGTMYVPE